MTEHTEQTGPPPAPDGAEGTTRTEEPEKTPARGPIENALRDIATGPVMTAFLSLVLAMLVGSVMILFTDEHVRATAGYIGARPSDFFDAVWTSISGAYEAMFRGAIYNSEGLDFQAKIRPITETLNFAAPLIMAGLGVGLAFRAGMFNIGGRGQMLLAGAGAGWVAINVDAPRAIHLPMAIVAGMLVGALWGGLAGFLKARTGAHEVIVTIMLNYVGYYLVFFALGQQSILQQKGSINPKSAPMPDSAVLPKLLGVRFNLHAGIILALLAVAFVWWLLNRSAWGYRFRAVGINPSAAQAAGIDVGRTYTTVMLIAGGLVGLAGVNQVLGTVTSGVSVDLDAGIGFDAITVALLGRSRPLGILAAGLLFGAFKAGGFAMQASQNIPVDIVLVIQSLIVLFIAAPPLVKAIFRIPVKEEA